MKMNRRSFLRGVGGVLASAALPSPLLARVGEPELRIGYLPITDATPLLVAHANGYFADEGLKVARPVLIRSWSALVEAFLTGKVNCVHMLLPIPVWMRFNRRARVKVLAWNHTNGSAVTVARRSGIRGFADLAGRQIAVPFWYSMHNVILQMGLRAAGLRPVIRPQNAPLAAREVNLFILPPPEMPAALAARKIDGFVVAEPFNALAEEKIGARILRFTGDIWQNHPCCVVVMDESLIRRRPAFAQKVVNGLVRAQLWASRTPGATARLLGRDGKGYLPVRRRVLERVFSGYELSRYGPGVVPQAIRHPDWPVRRIGFQPYPYPSATRFIVRELKQTVMEGDRAFLGRLDPDRAAAELVDDRFVKRAVTAAGGLGQFGPVFAESGWQREEVIDL